MTDDDQYKLAIAELNGRLFVPYQREGVQWLLKQERHVTGPKGGFLCDEMGLGKTVQLIAMMLGNPKKRSLLIVPKSLITQWVQEIGKFAPGLAVRVYDGPKRELDDALLCDPEARSVTIAPYSVLSAKGRKPEAKTPLHNPRWDRIILDEAHEIRNKRSKIFKNVCTLKTEVRWIVTGTPVFNSMEDFVSLCMFLGLDRQLVLAKPHDIKDEYILRRTKEDLAAINERLRLPPCTFENVELDMYDDEKSLYEFVFRDAQQTIREAFRESSSSYKNMVIVECLLRARQAMVWPQMYYDGVARKNGVEPEKFTGRSKKMETLFGFLEEHPQEKALIFCQFMGEMNHMETIFTAIYEEHGRKVFRIDGSVSKEARVQRIEAFKSSPPGSIFLMQIRCGGQGLNLQEATRIYITAPAWNPATELQAIGRSHRTGQTRAVHVKKLIYKECPSFISVEQEMMALQGHKSVVCSEVLNDERIKNQIPTGNRRVKKISILDIKKIFRA